MKKLLYAMRHGETLFNVQHKTQGWCDSPLTPRGIEQCRRAGEELKRRGVTFDHFYSSTSERCCDTMELVCETVFGETKPYRRMKGLRECGFGIFEGKDDNLEPLFGPVRSAVMKAGGGETDDEIFARMEGCLSEIMADPEAESVLVVSSGGSLRHFYMLHVQEGVEVRPGAHNCITYVYEWEDGAFRCVEVYTPDFTGLDESGIPYRWTMGKESFKALRQLPELA